MYRFLRQTIVLSAVITSGFAPPAALAGCGVREIRSIVQHAIEPLRRQYHVPGMAVAVVFGKETCFFNYGVASKQTRKPVSNETLFEIGSLSKTFAATLASYAQIKGRLSFADDVSQYLPSLRNSVFDHVNLLQIATQTSGLPLNVPDGIVDRVQLMGYLRAWRATDKPGTHRVYSTIGAGLLGLIAAKSLQLSYDAAIERKLFPAFDMTHSYLTVPGSALGDYAQGYTVADAPIRLKIGVLGLEAYAIRSCTADLARFIEANMGLIKVDDVWQRAAANTHYGYFESAGMTQSLIWEQYPYPTDLSALERGNDLIGLDVPTQRLVPPLPSRRDVLIDKTGSTNGFSTYVAYVPEKNIGVVMLANKYFPINDRVAAAYGILTALGDLLPARPGPARAHESRRRAP
jgi:beta-lactamase class C